MRIVKMLSTMKIGIDCKKKSEGEKLIFPTATLLSRKSLRIHKKFYNLAKNQR